MKNEDSDYTNLPIPIPRSWKKTAKELIQIFALMALFLGFFIGGIAGIKLAVCYYDKQKECKLW
jgi:hypothetical protein